MVRTGRNGVDLELFKSKTHKTLELHWRVDREGRGPCLLSEETLRSPKDFLDYTRSDRVRPKYSPTGCLLLQGWDRTGSQGTFLRVRVWTCPRWGSWGVRCLGRGAGVREPRSGLQFRRQKRRRTLRKGWVCFWTSTLRCPFHVLLTTSLSADLLLTPPRSIVWSVSGGERLSRVLDSDLPKPCLQLLTVGCLYKTNEWVVEHNRLLQKNLAILYF